MKFKKSILTTMLLLIFTILKISMINAADPNIGDHKADTSKKHYDNSVTPLYPEKTISCRSTKEDIVNTAKSAVTITCKTYNPCIIDPCEHSHRYNIKTCTKIHKEFIFTNSDGDEITQPPNKFILPAGVYYLKLTPECPATPERLVTINADFHILEYDVRIKQKCRIFTKFDEETRKTDYWWVSGKNKVNSHCKRNGCSYKSNEVEEYHQHKEKSELKVGYFLTGPKVVAGYCDDGCGIVKAELPFLDSDLPDTGYQGESACHATFTGDEEIDIEVGQSAIINCIPTVYVGYWDCSGVDEKILHKVETIYENASKNGVVYGQQVGSFDAKVIIKCATEGIVEEHTIKVNVHPEGTLPPKPEPPEPPIVDTPFYDNIDNYTDDDNDGINAGVFEENNIYKKPKLIEAEEDSTATSKYNIDTLLNKRHTSAGKYVNIYGQPISEEKPQQKSETDHISNNLKINAEDLSISYTTTDLSFPVGNGNLSFDFQRTYTPDKEELGILGRGWSSGLRVKGYLTGLNSDRFVKIVMGDNETVMFRFIKDEETGEPILEPYSISRDKSHAVGSKISFDAAAQSFVYEQKYGKKYYFKGVPCTNNNILIDQIIDEALNYTVSDIGLPSCAIYTTERTLYSFYLDKVEDIHGNKIQYSYSSSNLDEITGLELFNKGDSESFYNLNFTYSYESNRPAIITKILGSDGYYVEYIYDNFDNLIEVKYPQVTRADTGDSQPSIKYDYIKVFKLAANDIPPESKTEPGSPIVFDPPTDKSTMRYLLRSITDESNKKIEFTYDNLRFNYQYELRDAEGNLKYHPEDERNYFPLSRIYYTEGNEQKLLSRYALINSQVERNHYTNIYDAYNNKWQYCFYGVLSNFHNKYTKIRRTLIKNDTTKENEYWAYDETNAGFVYLSQYTDAYGNGTKYLYHNTSENDPYPYAQNKDIYKEIKTLSNGTKLTKTFQYDLATKRMKKIIDSKGTVSVYEMNQYGDRTKETTIFNGSIVKTMNFNFDSQGLMTQSIDGDGRKTLMNRQYTSEGWTDTTTIKGYNDELNIVSIKEFDFQGNLLKETDPKGNLTNYTYDKLNALIKKEYPAVNGIVATEEFVYNANGTVARKKNLNGTWTNFEYDILGRLIKETVELNGNISDYLVTEYGYDVAGNKNKITKPNGTVYRKEYDYWNRLVKSIRPNPAGGEFVSSYAYGVNSGYESYTDESGSPTQITNAKGVIDTFTYDNDYRPLTKMRDGKLLETYEYDKNGNLTKKIVKNPTVESGSGDQEVAYEYNAFNKMTLQVIDMNGNGANKDDADDLVTRYSYDISGNQILVTNPKGNTVQYEYDGMSRKVKEVINIDNNPTTVSNSGNQFAVTVSEQDFVTTYSYDKNSNILSTTVKNTHTADQVTVNIYDNLNRLVSTIDPLQNSESFTYDVAGNKISHTDKRNNVTNFEYDGLNRLVKTIYPIVLNGESGNNTQPFDTKKYDKNGNVTEVVNTRGVKTVNGYDILDRLISVTIDPDDANFRTLTEYDALDNVVKTTIKRGSADTEDLVSTNIYDNFNRVISVTDSGGFTENFTYDLVGNKISSTNKRGKVTFYSYDKANRLITTMLPSTFNYQDMYDVTGTTQRSTVTNEYDKLGNIVKVTDAMGNNTYSIYDAANRKVEVRNDAGQKTNYEYDQTGNIVKQTVLNSTSLGFTGDQVTTYSYNKLNQRLTETLNPNEEDLERTYSYEYDASGNQTANIKPDGTRVELSYDALNRVSQKHYPSESLNDISFEYNLNGNVTKAVDSTGTTSYTYNNLEQVVTENKLTTSGQNYLVVSEYDKVGNRIKVTYPGGRFITSEYDLRNNLIKSTDANKVTTYEYNENGSRIKLTLPNGNQTITSYDDAERVLELNTINTTNSNVIYKSRYYLNANGERVRVTEQRPSLTGITENGLVRTMKYAYDAVGQLSTEIDDISGNEIVTIYSYDLLGNRLTKQVDAVTTNYNVDKLNRVLSYNDDTNTVNYIYDANGNRISKTFDGNTHEYQYDSDGRLIKVLENSSEIFSAKYDYRMRRTETFENNTVKHYIYDGGTNIQERSATGSLTKQLIRGSGMGGGIGSVLYTDSSEDGADDEDGESEQRRFFIYNAIGSTVALTNAVSEVMSANCYDAFGKVVASLTDGEDTETRKFCTKERSESIGLDNFGFRYYDYELGRFLTRDPAGYPDGPNNYLYCNNNPVNKIDPLGLWGWWKSLKKSVKSLVDDAKMMADAFIQDPRSMSEAFNSGLKTGAKAVTNAAADTVVSTATLGFVDKVEVFEVTAEDRANGYDAAYGVSRVGTEILAATATMGLGNVSNGGKLVCNAQKTLTVMDALQGAADVGRAGADMIENGVTWQNSLQMLGGAVSMAPMTKFSKIKCFPAGTLVLMADGTSKPIEEIRLGDYVIALNPEDDLPPTAYKVTALLRNNTKTLVNVSIDYNHDGISDGVIQATEEHPFYTTNRGWIDAVDLNVEDKLFTVDGKLVDIVNVSVEDNKCATYNLTIDQAHTYYVTVNNTSILVHNDCENPANKYKGGIHKETSLPVGDGLDSHHMYADSINGLPKSKGPAIQMDPWDHKATPSWGNKKTSQQFNASQKKLLEQGEYRKAMANEIRGVRKAAQKVSGDRTKYNKAMQQMLQRVKDDNIYDLSK
ncbi:polymorphic toxin-type HINT domain-containing protein [Lentisphaerota bacterium WC36G]|nr:hypothetical protein LJT99_04585 [Lentisphaerae bacterium WC36]